MAISSNSEKYIRTITPINNLQFYKSIFKAKKGNEHFLTEVYYTEPDRGVYPDNSSYQDALEVFNKNEKAFKQAKVDGMATEEFENGKKYFVDLGKGNPDVESISGYIINAFIYDDVFPSDGNTASRCVLDMADFKSKERYRVELPLARTTRDFIDKLCTLTPEQLVYPIEISLNRFADSKGVQRLARKVKVLDPNAEYGKYEVERVYENSVYNKKEGINVPKPRGDEKLNKVYLDALKMAIEDEAPKRIKKFYLELFENFAEKIVKPFAKKLFEGKGWEIEKIEDKERVTFVKTTGEEVTFKYSETMWLTPISSNESTVGDTQEAKESPEPVTSNEKSDEDEGDLPF